MEPGTTVRTGPPPRATGSLLTHVFRVPQGTGLHELLTTLGAAEAGMPARDGLPINSRCVQTGATVIHEGAEPRSLLVVRSGSFKCVKMLEDGYEQVLSFASRGDVLGFEALARGRSPTSAVALEVATVHPLPLPELPAWRRDCPALDRALQRALARQLARAGDIAEMLAAVAAEVRLARFLVWLSARMAEDGQSPQRLWLRLGRRDIASLLGMAHSTVSRTFTTLAARGHLRVDNRSVEILDLEGLRASARCTRAPIDRKVAAPRPAVAA